MPTSGGAKLCCAAPAKLNLYLHVTGRRPDGYHLLDSLMVFTGLHDTVTVGWAPDLTLTVEGPFGDRLAVAGDNLVLRAARRLAEAVGVPAEARIHLVKRVPVAAGLGGGSADAAAALKALDGLWGTCCPPAALAAIALDLGADVPVCLAGRAAFVGGIGEEIAPVSGLPAAWAVLVNPGAALETPAVFAARSGAFSAVARFTEMPAGAAELATLLSARRNDLTAAAIGLLPEVGLVLGALESAPGALLARMSGSGATCFALFAEESAARNAAQDIIAAEPAWWVAAAPLLAAANGLETAA